MPEIRCREQDFSAAIKKALYKRVVGKPAELKDDWPTKRELRRRQYSEAGGAGGGGAHFRGVDTEAKMREVRLAEGHEASVEVAPDEEEQKGNCGVIFVHDGIDDSSSEIETKQYFGVGHP